MRLCRDSEQDQELQAQNMLQERHDARVCAVLLAVKAMFFSLVALGLAATFFWFVTRSSSGSNYMVFYLIWPLLGLAGGIVVKARQAWTEACERLDHISRVHIMLRSHDNTAEFKAVGRYLENCGIMCPHLRLRIHQDEDDVEEVRFQYTPWARSFTKRACVYGDSGEASSLVFRTFCIGRVVPRWLGRRCPSACSKCGYCQHGHLEVRYQRSGEWGPTGESSGGGDSITFSVEDHHAKAIQNLILRAHAEFMRPRTTKVDVYAATAQQGQGPGATIAPASWEFMQYISPLAQERTGRFTYVPGEAFAQIEEEYRRVVSIGNESLTVLVTGRSRAGKSAMVTALAHRLGLPVYNLNLKARFLLDGGVDALFSHRAIPHRPVLVHIEEFSMMFQETVTTESSSEHGPHYEGLQSSMALNCSDLLKLFDQSGTTSPKRILFVLTCIELPRQFDRIAELRPLLARGRIQHYQLEEPTDEVISQYLLQYFYPEVRRAALPAAERQRLDTYKRQMQASLGPEWKNWHAAKRYAEKHPLSRLPLRS
jgi:hypothetical protein